MIIQNDGARLGQERVLAGRGWAGEKVAFLSILLEIEFPPRFTLLLCELN